MRSVPLAPLLARSGWLALAWVAMDGITPLGLLAGVPAALLAAWLSLLLWPGAAGLRWAGLARLAARALVQLLRGGIDVARRVFAPALPVQPGMVSVPAGLAPGPRLAAFCTLASLVPGTLPAGEAGADTILLHALDTSLPVREAWQADQAAFAAALAPREPWRG